MAGRIIGRVPGAAAGGTGRRRSEAGGAGAGTGSLRSEGGGIGAAIGMRCDGDEDVAAAGTRPTEGALGIGPRIDPEGEGAGAFLGGGVGADSGGALAMPGELGASPDLTILRMSLGFEPAPAGSGAGRATRSIG